MQLPRTFFQDRKLEQLVENRTVYTAEGAELNVYETHHFAEQVMLEFNQPVFASMIEGKKIMHLDEAPFAFLPGESLIMPSDKTMTIDFPEARMDNPTKCLAMTICPQKIRSVVSELNDQYGKADGRAWLMPDFNFSFTNSQAISQIIQRIIFLFAEGHTSKDFFVNLMLKELLVRVLQAENKQQLLHEAGSRPTAHRMAGVIEYIDRHLHEQISIADLSHEACMSESTFHRVFRQELGQTPIQYIKEARVKRAKEMLQNPELQIKEVYMECGFNDLSYFMRIFKQLEHQTPGEYRSAYRA